MLTVTRMDLLQFTAHAQSPFSPELAAESLHLHFPCGSPPGLAHFGVLPLMSPAGRLSAGPPASPLPSPPNSTASTAAQTQRSLFIYPPRARLSRHSIQPR